jgi:outer membrane biosynthesis protein TonB
MTGVPQRLGGQEARRPRLRDRAGLIASALAHALLLLAIVLIGSPQLFATVAPEPIVVEIVRPEELAEGKMQEPTDAKWGQAQPQKQQQQAEPQKQQQQTEPQKQQQKAQPQKQQQQAEPQKQQVQAQQQPQTQSQPLPVSVATPATPRFASLYPWPVAQPGSDTQAGDYRTFESTGKLEHNELAQFKARLKECWRPRVAGSNRKLTAALRVALRMDGSLAGAPELVEVSASPDAVALVASAKQALAECGPYGFLPAESYDTWKALSLTFSPDDILVAAVTR